jgi:hypothetical protein
MTGRQNEVTGAGAGPRGSADEATGALGPNFVSDPMQAGDVHEQMRAMAMGYWVSQIVRAVVDLSLADHLTGEPLTAADVAEREGSAPNSTFRLMRACVAMGLLSADADGRFSGTALLATLRKDAPNSMRDLALTVTGPAHWLPWSQFTTSVRSGRSQTAAVLGLEFFDYLEQHPPQAREFTAAMGSLTSQWTANAAKAIDTTDISLAVDVGGATGSLLHLLQEANPMLRGIVFDRPNIVDYATDQIARKGLTARTEVVGGDFFESVPSADMYLLKFILHDWDDQRAIKILQRCREAMTPGARIAIVEMVVGRLSNPGPAALMDLNMLAICPGQERSLAEYDALLAAAGLRRTAVYTTNSPQTVIEAVAT